METKRIKEIVAGLREKPEHVRQNMAFGVAAGTTLVVAIAWVGVMAVTGSFSLVPAGNQQIAQSGTDAAASQAAPTPSSLSQLMASAGAAFTGATTTAPAHINIVDSNPTTTQDQAGTPANATVIHF